MVKSAQFTLSTGWSLQSSAKITQAGGAISTPGFQPTGWYPITVPATIVAGLLQNNVYADPYYGQNLSLINAADFTPAWWYRTEFTLPSSENGKRVWLKLEGLNYQANVWFNGTEISTATNTVGPFRSFEFDVTNLVNYTSSNALAIQITPPANYTSDLTVYFVDWLPTPPDKSGGILNDVIVSTSGPANIRHPLVSTTFDLPSLNVAHLTVVADVTNGTSAAVSATVNGTIGNIAFSQAISLAANSTQTVTFTPTVYPQLNVTNPSIWWPWQYGTPNLNTLTLNVSIGGQVSDSLTTQFGIRQVTSTLDANGDRLFSVNGKPIEIRGAAWRPDLFQRRTPARQATEMQYVRDLNLNCLRFEGKFEDDNLFQLADQEGIFVMIGWCCCDAWQSSASWTAAQTAIAMDSLRNQMYRLRIHPSMLVWLNGSDEAAAASVEQSYVTIESQLQWPNPTIASAATDNTKAEGSTGVKMNGPYDYEPPTYWETDTQKVGGGAWGFSTEISPGADVPTIESLTNFIPAANLWPIGADWTFHCGKSPFSDLSVNTNSINNRYGAATSAADYAAKSQISTYESHRAMFEAYGRQKYVATGVIQWMLNNGWPGMFWQLYDYYLQPCGSYYGVKNALEPLHIQYSYVAKTVTVLNSTLQTYSNLTANVLAYNSDGTQKYSHAIALGAVGADSTTDILSLPAMTGLTPTYFLRLTLTDANSQTVSINTYWLSSTKTDVVNWGSYGNPWQYTVQSSYADLTGIATMPAASVSFSAQTSDSGTQESQNVTLTNTGSTIAFFLRLKVVRSTDGQEVLPAIWQDNYVTLLPGESRRLNVSYAIADLDGASAVLKVVPYLPNVTVTGGGTPTVATPTFNPGSGSYTSAQSVTISDATSGATIRYTTDGSTPTESHGSIYSGPLSIAVATALEAIAYESGFTDSQVATATYTIGTPSQVAAPTFSPAGGSYTSAQSVTISDATGGATIRYTTDESTPSEAVGTLYSGPVSISVTSTLKAIAYESGMTDSSVTAASYAISTGGGSLSGTSGDGFHNLAISPAQTGTFTATFDATPSVAPENALVGLSQGAATAYGSISCIARFNPTGGIDAYNGTAYGASALTYSAGVSYHFRFVVNVPAHTYSVYVTPSGGSELTVGLNYAFRSTANTVTGLDTWTLDVNPAPANCSLTAINLSVTGTVGGTVSAPAFSPAGGTFTVAQSVMISDSTGGASIRYTTDGSTPSEAVGTLYSGPVNISVTSTLKAIAYESGMTDSSITSATYTIATVQQQVATPTFSPAGGTYTSAQSVSISDSTGGATIYYTTNSSTPTTSSAVYSGPISVSSGTVMIEAIGAKSGMTNSAVATTTYTIGGASNRTLTGSSGNGWHALAISPAAAGTFTATFDATPSISPENALVGLSNGAATGFGNLGCIARFNPSGEIDAYNGTAYGASTITYSAGVSYHFRLVVNVTAHTYSVYVTPAGGSEVSVGVNYAFRSSANTMTSLNNWNLVVDPAIGGASLTANNLNP